MAPYSVVLGNYPHTKGLKDGSITVPGVDCAFPDIKPVHSAFAHMVRELRYDVSEMAIATYLQARDVGKPITLLPIVMIGSLHHHSITRWPTGNPIDPADLAGKRVGVRAYSQTTGLWVRGILKEEYGIESSDITWVTTEAPHVFEYVEPAYVERSSLSLAQMLESGDVVAAVLGPPALASQGIELVPIIANYEAAEKAWEERHQTISVNHILTVKTELLHKDPAAVKAIYSTIAKAIADTSSERPDKPSGKVVAAGITPSLRNSIEVAIQYALEQELISKVVTVDEIFEESDLYLD